jgi:LmbE family N-acetylglucosaminyl deacetylase
VLGVRPEDCLFLDWSDASPFAHDHPAYARTLERLAGWANGFAPRSLWASWREEAHCDHVAAGELAADLAGRLPSLTACMEFLVWGWKARSARFDGKAVWSLACADTVERRRKALACHRTQMTGLIDDARTAFRIPPALAALTDRPVEIYLEAS